MNLTLAELGTLAVLIILLVWKNQSRIFFALPVSLIIFPTARIFLGFPLYLYDLALVGAAFLYRRELLALPWSARQIPWHYVFAGLIFICGLWWPIAVFGAHPAIIWVALHASLAFVAFGLGAILIFREELRKERFWLGAGLLVSVIGLGLIALIQFGSPEASAQIANFFFRDFDEEGFMRSEGFAAFAAARAMGPYGSPNLLGVTAVLCLLLLSVTMEKRLFLVGAAFALVAIAASVSRQAMIALGLSSMIYVLAARRLHSRRFVVVGAVVFPLMLVAIAASPFAEAITERFGRWETGVASDENFTARYVEGPKRLFEAVQEYPSIIALGTGPDIGKLSTSGVIVDSRRLGFLSIAYALVFFQYGLIGFASILLMHAEAARNLRHLPGELRGQFAAIVATIMIFYFADNAPQKSETVLVLCLLPLGLLAGYRLRATHGQAVSKGAPRRAVFGEPEVDFR